MVRWATIRFLSCREKAKHRSIPYREWNIFITEKSDEGKKWINNKAIPPLRTKKRWCRETQKQKAKIKKKNRKASCVLMDVSLAQEMWSEWLTQRVWKQNFWNNNYRERVPPRSNMHANIWKHTKVLTDRLTSILLCCFVEIYRHSNNNNMKNKGKKRLRDANSTYKARFPVAPALGKKLRETKSIVQTFLVRHLRQRLRQRY